MIAYYNPYITGFFDLSTTMPDQNSGSGLCMLVGHYTANKKLDDLRHNPCITGEDVFGL